MKKIKFPVLDGKMFGGVDNCLICNKKTFPGVIVNFGALLQVGDPKTRSYEISEKLLGFFSLSYHDESEIGIYIADNLPSGQAELYFCSTDCLRKFFELCVDELDKKIRKKKKGTKKCSQKHLVE